MRKVAPRSETPVAATRNALEPCAPSRTRRSRPGATWPRLGGPACSRYGSRSTREVRGPPRFLRTLRPVDFLAGGFVRYRMPADPPTPLAPARGLFMLSSGRLAHDLGYLCVAILEDVVGPSAWPLTSLWTWGRTASVRANPRFASLAHIHSRFTATSTGAHSPVTNIGEHVRFYRHLAPQDQARHGGSGRLLGRWGHRHRFRRDRPLERDRSYRPVGIGSRSRRAERTAPGVVPNRVTDRIAPRRRLVGRPLGTRGRVGLAAGGSASGPETFSGHTGCVQTPLNLACDARLHDAGHAGEPGGPHDRLR